MQHPFCFKPQDLILPQLYTINNSSSDANSYLAEQTILYSQYLKILAAQREQQAQQQLQNIFFFQHAQRVSQLDSLKKQLQFDLKQEPFAENPNPSLNVRKVEAFTPETEESDSTTDNVCRVEENHQNKIGDHLRTQISDMLSFILATFGKTSKEDMGQQRKKYAYNKVLLTLFDCLVEKYQSAAKCREDMVRFILRKTITSLRDDVRRKQNLNCKGALLVLCKRYFDIKSHEEIKEKLGADDEEEILSFLLPYKKHSRNRTANASFINEIFASQVFLKDYQEYLTKFDKILANDNQKKSKKFVDFLVRCVKENKMNDVKKYKRLPWVDSWLEATKVIADELLTKSTCDDSITKKVKLATSKK